MSLAYLERPADGDAEGLVILHHGRGSHEGDLIGLADELDPEQRLHVVAPRAPLSLPGMPGFHWYAMSSVGHPDGGTFDAAVHTLADFHDETWRRTGLTPLQTVLGGFSMGSAMSYSLALPSTRPSVAGLLIYSGFVPVAEGWHADLKRHAGTRVLISHGRQDIVVDIGFAREARQQLADGGLDVEYHEFDGGHWVDPPQLERSRTWLGEVLLGTSVAS